MWTRGADSDGFVANFVETEQIMQLNGKTASFIQVSIGVQTFSLTISSLQLLNTNHVTRINKRMRMFKISVFEKRKPILENFIVHLK